MITVSGNHAITCSGHGGEGAYFSKHSYCAFCSTKKKRSGPTWGKLQPWLRRAGKASGGEELVDLVPGRELEGAGGEVTGDDRVLQTRLG